MKLVGIKHRIVELLSQSLILSKKGGFPPKGGGWNSTPIEPDKSLLNVSSTNNIIELWYKEKKYYLRLIEKQVKNKEIIDYIIFKYECLSGSPLPEIVKEQVLKKSELFLKMGYIDDFSSLVYRFFKDNDPNILGISLDKNIYSLDDLKGFIHFAWSEIASFKRNAGSGGWTTFNYNRCRGQEMLFQLLGVERLICPTTLVKVCIGEFNCYGYLMDEAEGKNPLDLKNEDLKNSATEKLRKELNTLNIMDVLCYERDHRPGNYNVIYDERKEMLVSVRAFDNDSDFAFFPICSVKKSFVGASPIVKEKGVIFHHCMDDNFVKSILSIKDEQVVNSVKQYLNRIQQKCLLIRLHKLQKAIRESFKISNTQNDVEVNLKQKDNAYDYMDVLMNWKETAKDAILLEQHNFRKIVIDQDKVKIWTEITR